MRASPPESLRAHVHALLHHVGLDVIRYSPTHFINLRRQEIIDKLSINVVLDIGASIGQYGEEIRRNGYKSRIISFEPLAEPFTTLASKAAQDSSWQCLRTALGNEDRSASINVSKNQWSSSFLQIADRHLAVAPASAYRGSEEVRIARLDSLAPELLSPGDRTLMKLDVQGFEMQVISGAGQTLEAIDVIELELSLVQLYEGQALLHEVVDALYSIGFSLVWLEPGLSDPAEGHLLQLDAILERRLASDRS